LVCLSSALLKVPTMPGILTRQDVV
jgi:hypothetical protein